MLRLAGETKSSQERIEVITYNPGLQDSGDLESGTKIITAIAEASGVANADYSKALTLSKPDDARLVVKRIAARLQVTRDSGTSNNLYCRVYVDVQDADHRLFDVDAQANSLSATQVSSGTIFDLLSDGASHTFYFFFWVDSGDSVISLVRLWEGVGIGGITTWQDEGLELIHTGFAWLNIELRREGTGSPYARLDMESGSGYASVFTMANWSGHGDYMPDMGGLFLSPDKVYLKMNQSVATDLTYIYKFRAILRSEQ